MSETKPTNPKDAIGSDKLPLHLFPTTAKVYGCLGLLDGALKYGRSNWRAMGVRASIYYDAIGRHLDAWFEGEDFAPDSDVHHLAHAIAGIAILIDATEAGNMSDDRMIPLGDGGFRGVVDGATPSVKDLKEQHKDKNPHHYTIQDGSLTQLMFDPDKFETLETATGTPEFKEELFGLCQGIQFPMSTNSVNTEAYTPLPVELTQELVDDKIITWEDCEPEVETLTGCFEYEDDCEHCENISLREQLDQRDAEAVTWKKRIEELVGDKIILENQLKIDRRDSYEVIQENLGLKNQVRDLEPKDVDENCDITALRDRVIQLELDKAALLKGAEVRQKDAVELNRQINRVKQEMSVGSRRQSETVKELNAELDSYIRQFGNTRDELAKALREIDSLNDNIDTMRENQDDMNEW